MKTVRAFAILLFFMTIFFSTYGNLFAEEAGVNLNAIDSVKELLKTHIGKRVSLKTDSGETLEGIIVKVGDHLVHISKLSGKDFYDGAVRIEKINAVIFKARSN
jgi:hypothetical protein